MIINYCFQVMIINAVKDVASALSDLISATKNASGKNVSDPAMLTLKESAKVSRGCVNEQCIDFCLKLSFSKSKQ